MIEEPAAAAVIIALIFEKNKSMKKRQKRRVCLKPWLKRRKTLDFMKLCLQNCGLKTSIIITFYLRMTSKNFQEILHQKKDDTAKENTKMRKLIPSRLKHAATIGFLSTGKLYKSYGYEYYSFYSTMNSSTFTSFGAFVFSIFPSPL